MSDKQNNSKWECVCCSICGREIGLEEYVYEPENELWGNYYHKLCKENKQ